MPKIQGRKTPTRKPPVVPISETVQHGKVGISKAIESTGTMVGTIAESKLVRDSAKIAVAAGLAGTGLYAAGNLASKGAKAIGLIDKSNADKVNEYIDAIEKLRDVTNTSNIGLPPGRDPRFLENQLYRDITEEPTVKWNWLNIALGFAGVGAAAGGIYLAMRGKR